MAFLVKNSLQPLPDNICCCGVKAHYSNALKATSSSVNENNKMGCRWTILCLFYWAGGQLRATILSIMVERIMVDNQRMFTGRSVTYIIKEKGILVEQSAKSIRSKIIHMETMYKDTSDWLA
jgi:hypothetical protein